MEQRTCNIIMCCKGHCELPGGKDRDKLTAIAAYMADECACPQEVYEGPRLEQIMQTALFDYLNGARRPGDDLRRLFDRPGMGPEPSMSERIAGVFSGISIRRAVPDSDPRDLFPEMEYDNGFTEALIRQSRIDLGHTVGPDAVKTRDGGHA